jgi:hypothetical protein
VGPSAGVGGLRLSRALDGYTLYLGTVGRHIYVCGRSALPARPAVAEENGPVRCQGLQLSTEPRKVGSENMGKRWREFTRIYRSDERLLGSSNGFGGEGEGE